ncbi:hypothetical protein N0V90_009204 [Kalmusia sp. IMI 367209]|nr:hypothetical protein N0V90_009204 [Kalmusia sp. IMI 367209]
MSPSTGSKIPRKAPKPAPRAVTFQLGAAAAPHRTMQSKLGRGAREPAISPSAIPVCIVLQIRKINGLTDSQKPKLSPVADRDKPLPSPPILQIINPTSPLKAQRTLIDADVAGTPSTEEWPILPPDNVPSRHNDSRGDQITNTFVDCYNHVDPVMVQEQELTFYVPDHPDTALLTTRCDLEPTQMLATTPDGYNTSATSQNAMLIDLDPSSGATVHAITTSDDEALESPLARKLALPSRISSKRVSLLAPSQLQEIQLVEAADSASPHQREGKEGNTKWPLLETEAHGTSNVTKPLTECSEAEDLSDSNAIRAHDMPESTDTHHIAVSKRASLDSVSIWSMAAGSSIDDDESDADAFPYNRIKRLSDHSFKSGLGPILRIADDADVVLLGDGVPPVPSIPRQSTSSLAGRLSRQTVSRLPGGMISRASVTQPVDGNNSSSVTTRISPIGPTYPSKKTSARIEPKSSSSPIVPSTRASRRSSGLPMRRSLGSVRRTPRLENNSSSQKRSSRIASKAASGRAKDKTDEKVPLLSPTPVKADRIVGDRSCYSVAETSKASTTPKGSHVDGLLRARNMATDRSRTSPALVRVSPHDRRTKGTGGGSPSTPSLPVSRTVQSPGAPSPGLDRVTHTGRITSARNETNSAQRATFRKVENKSLESKSEQSINRTSNDEKGSRSKEKSQLVDTSKKIKSKRSFREFFHIRDTKEKVPPLPPVPVEPKRSSLVTGNTLAKRFRTSANSSKANMKTTEPDLERRPKPNAEGASSRKQDNANQVVTSSTPASDAPSASCSDTATIVNNILSRVALLPESSPHRLRGLEITEVCTALHNHSCILKELLLTVGIKQAVLNSFDAYKKAQISATKAQKHARQAELNAQRASVELGRLQQLCEPELDDETVRAIKDLVRSVSSVEPEPSLSPSPQLTSTPQ